MASSRRTPDGDALYLAMVSHDGKAEVLAENYARLSNRLTDVQKDLETTAEAALRPKGNPPTLYEIMVVCARFDETTNDLIKTADAFYTARSTVLRKKTALIERFEYDLRPVSKTITATTSELMEKFGKLRVQMTAELRAKLRQCENLVALIQKGVDENIQAASKARPRSRQ